MGYDLHIVREKEKSKEEGISANEWLALIARDPELELNKGDGLYLANWRGTSDLKQPWLDWSEGEIYAKNPDLAFVKKMVMIAGELGAVVRGDDGEQYGTDGRVVAALAPSLSVRLGMWMRNAWYAFVYRSSDAIIPFKVGEVLVDSWGMKHTVTALEAESKLPNGRIRMGGYRARTEDGNERTHVWFAHGMKPIAKRSHLRRIDARDEPHLVWNACINMNVNNEIGNMDKVQRQAAYVFWYESEVQNGGHAQYFENRGMPEAFLAIEALRGIGAVEQADLLERARDEKVKDNLDVGTWDPLDQAFHKCQTPLNEHLKKYFEEHIDEFVSWD